MAYTKPYNIHLGNCLEALKGIPDNSVDSIVTDPPYGLSFMGKKWDYDVPEQAIWEECLRVLKPGGHLLAFAGTRTQHRMAVRIEDAGFEIRDMIAWVYGSGFPKSMDVSKAIDKMDAADARRERQLRFTEWMRSTGLTSAEINRITDTNMGSHYTTAASQPSVATREHFEKLRPYFGVDVPEWVEQLVDERTVESENFKRRQVVGRSSSGIAGGSGKHAGEDGAYGFGAEFDITAPATDAARQWQGWGTALKPAIEPITVARKPLKGTVADNVLAHGTGALNIDGCRINPVELAPGGGNGKAKHGGNFAGEHRGERPKIEVHTHGRWPANLIHDGGAEVDDSLGSASRFFYCAKTSRKDRGEGNTHPTVKPTDLMVYLCRLVTPPGGVVLDPFMGSGSTGKAAMREGFRFIGIEMDAYYLAIAEARIAHEAGK